MTSQTAPIEATLLGVLRRHLRGATIGPTDDRYAIGRRVWNAAIDRHPRAIAFCADAEDVALALRIAAEHGVAVTVRGGGHNVAGRSVADDALLIDLSRLRSVAVNAGARIAIVQGGAQWHDVDVATASHGLATTGGLVSGTGVGGFTLGGGAGWLMRRYGLAIDNLDAAGVVLADGRIVRASVDEQDELFWALRGGAGGFGIVTTFEFRLHDLRQVLAGVIIRPAEEAREALGVFRDFALAAPDEFCGMAVLAHAPPLPFLDAAWHGRPVLIQAVCWCGDGSVGERTLEPLRRFGRPLADHVGPIPYVQWQHLQDPGAPLGRCQYWKTASYAALADATLDTLAAAALDLPTRQTEIHVQHMGGAVARVPVSETAFAQRETAFFVNLIGVTPWPEELPSLRARVRSLYASILPQALPALLPNFSNDEDGNVTELPGAASAVRLAALRRRYDPAGLFASV